MKTTRVDFGLGNKSDSNRDTLSLGIYFLLDKKSYTEIKKLETAVTVRITSATSFHSEYEVINAIASPAYIEPNTTKSRL